MSDELHTSGCGCDDCSEMAAEMRDNPRQRMTPQEWAEREKKAGRDRFGVRHFGVHKPGDPSPKSESDPHYRVVDRLANKAVLTPLSLDEEGKPVGGCRPLQGTVGQLIPKVKELQGNYVYHPFDDRFDFVEDTNPDPSLDPKRPRYQIFDRAAGTMVVPKNKRGQMILGFKTENATRKWLKENRKSIAKFTCPTTGKSLKNFQERIAARSPEVKRSKEVAQAKKKAEAALRKAQTSSSEYAHAQQVLDAIQRGQPIPSKPAKPGKPQAPAPAPRPAPVPEPSRPRGRIEVERPAPAPAPMPQRPAEVERFRGRLPAPGPSIPSPLPPPRTSYPTAPVTIPSPPPEMMIPQEPERARGRIMNPAGAVPTKKLASLEKRVDALETGQDKIAGAVRNLSGAVKDLDNRTAAGFRSLGAAKNVMRQFESGKKAETAAKPKKTTKPKAKSKGKRSSKK